MASTSKARPGLGVAAKSLRLSVKFNEKMVTALERRVLQLFAEVENLPPTISRQNGNVQVRTLFTDEEGQEGRMVNLCEFKNVDFLPQDFQVFFDNFSDILPKVDDLVSTATVVESGAERQGMKVTMEMPFPLAPRITFYYKYSLKHRAPDEHMLILSEVDTEHLIQECMEDGGEYDKYTLARTFLSVYWVKPVYGDAKDSSKVTGSQLKYAWSGDMGGLLPTWVQNSAAPKQSLDAIKRLVEFVAEHKAANGSK
mmetsp:Transcript_20817/g.45083  ORF Transcript_20817/g.45083 Transcript_20817/m.45083 type:complete len:255 (+) Transcript_20817:39-803(+)|eukprot:CAMPEP_0168745346 /NCGR_PEP_ID=MMETSP0724-20121128/14564_1 /TAXON_ID=265536 /ORGANISM="Amphiprora sp., Strain CCMP467" /LENGTH=254 /DNA_ID=CAMNT_0008793043 /DNA_START=35 /DNA_END=799 /DNA_ORIENTATION=-